MQHLLDFERPIAELDALIEELKSRANDPEQRSDAIARSFDLDAEIARIEIQRDKVMHQVFDNLTPWNQVQMARHPLRPYTLDYIRLMFDQFTELHGDRINADDQAIVGGMARFQGECVMVIGHQKGRDLRDRQVRNFGSARPAGFRKALRLMEMAARFGKPIITLIDTPAAEANLMAEEEGISRAIAQNLEAMFKLPVPIIVAIIGEGGSGGALGIAVGDRVLMMEHAIYSVIPPESCAAILSEFGRDRANAPQAAAALKITAAHAHKFEVVDEVLVEPLGGAHREPHTAASTLAAALSRNLHDLKKMKPAKLMEHRYERFRKLGQWLDPEALILEATAKPANRN